MIEWTRLGLKQEKGCFSQLFIGVAPGTLRETYLSSLLTFFAYPVHWASDEHGPLHGCTALRSSHLVMEQPFLTLQFFLSISSP